LAQDSAAVRDTVKPPLPLTSGFTLRRQLLRSLPLDDPRDALGFYPGVVSRDDARGVLGHGDLSLRGGAPGEASVYVDGAPARRWLFGTDGAVPGLVAIEEIVVTTGVPDVAVSDARGGVIAYTTRSGGAALAGDLRSTTDEFFGSGSTVGYNTFDGWVGGPLPGVRRATWFVSGTAQGQRSQYRSSLVAGIPLYVTGATDTVVSTVAVPRYVQWSGECGTTGNATTPVGRDIRDNYGAECRGLERAMDWSSALRAHARLTFAYGEDGSVSLTGLAARRQERRFPGEVIGAPTLYRGLRESSRLVVATWRHPLRLAGADAAARVTLSLGADRSIAGPLASSSETATREPALGIEWSALRFEGEDIMPVPITDAIVRNVRTNTGLRVPYLDRDDLLNSQRGLRLNPYGLRENGWYLQGLGTTIAFGDEQRLHANASLEWLLFARHRVILGMDADRIDASLYSSHMIRQSQFEAFIVHPRRWGAYAADRVGVGRGALEVGVRWDRFSSDARYPRTPGRLVSHPRYGMYPNAGTDDAQYVAYLADDSIWVPASAQSAASPRIAASYPIGAATALRASYGEHVEPPSLEVLYRGANNDLNLTSVSAGFGRDVRFTRVSAAELGVRHHFGEAWMADGAVHRRSGLRAYGFPFAPFADPFNPGDTLFAAALQRVPGSTTTGLDVLLAWRPTGWLDAMVGYGLQRNTQRTGDPLTIQTVAGVVGLSVPDGEAPRSTLAAVARGARAYVTFRMTSGRPYTRVFNSGAGWTIGDGTRGSLAGPFNASRTPWTKHLDLRVDKRWRTAGVEWSVFADLRNVLGFDNLVDLFTETGDTANALHRELLLGPELVVLRLEAGDAGALGGDGTTIDLRGNCQAWVTPANCVSLVRVENRFGDGDGLYAAAEQERALNAYYDAFFGAWRFYEPGRTLRAGVQIGF
jgi:hypothetical protein